MWKRQRLNLPINPSGIQDAVSVSLRPIEQGLSALSSSLRLLSGLIANYDEPVFSRLARGLKATIDSVSNTGLYYCEVIPTIDNLMSTEECLDLLAESVTDSLDDSRPIIVGSSSVDMTLIAFESGSLGGIVEILKLLSDLINIPEILYSYDISKYRTPKREYVSLGGDSQYPDWTSGNLFSAIPFLEVAASNISNQLDSFIVPNQSDTIGIAIALIDEKISIINRILSTLYILRDTYLSILNIGDLMVYNINGVYSSTELAGKIISAREELEVLRRSRSGIIVDKQTSNTSILTEVKHKQEGVNVGAVFAFAINTPEGRSFADIMGV